ncbi:hypothetical protein [Shimazuella kribbensis]|uniref:hypothetical protein n=1 Tax=Shimazuella kribbensis TaxID=139808 RepID=UPI00040787C2|nr:hypothetical protein [Shimazuella kribbensis]
MAMKIKNIIYHTINTNPEIELSKFLHDETISRYKLLIFFQKLEALTEVNLTPYKKFVRTCTDEKLFNLYAYLGYYIMQAEIDRAKNHIESLFKKDTI